jgi:hypothetical protein
MKKSNAAADDNIGAISALTFLKQFSAGTQNHALCAKGKQPQVLSREGLEQADRAQELNVIIECHLPLSST